MEKVTGRKSISAHIQGWNTADCSTDYHTSDTNQEDIQTKSFRPKFGLLAFLKKSSCFANIMSKQQALTDSQRMSSLMFAIQWTIHFEMHSPQQLANSRLSPSHMLTEMRTLWKRSQRWPVLISAVQYHLSLRSLSRKDGAMFKHYPLPSCKFLYCFYSLSQAGESQNESESQFSLYDSFTEHRNNNANIHLKEVTFLSRLTNFHVFLVQKLEFPLPPFMHRLDFVSLWK